MPFNVGCFMCAVVVRACVESIEIEIACCGFVHCGDNGSVCIAFDM